MKKILKQITILAVVLFFYFLAMCVDCASCPEGVTLEIKLKYVKMILIQRRNMTAGLN